MNPNISKKKQIISKAAEWISNWIKNQRKKWKKKIEDFGNLIITAYVKFKAQSITISNLSPKKKI